MTLKESVVPAALGAAATMVVGIVITSLLGTYKGGVDAAEEEHILQVITEYHLANPQLTEDDIKRALAESQTIDIDGKTLTYGQALSMINTTTTEIQSEQKHMKEALERLTE